MSDEMPDSNEVCLAKTMLALCDALESAEGVPFARLEELIHDGQTYAHEVLNARA